MRLLFEASHSNILQSNKKNLPWYFEVFNVFLHRCRPSEVSAARPGTDRAIRWSGRWWNRTWHCFTSVRCATSESPNLSNDIISLYCTVSWPHCTTGYVYFDVLYVQRTLESTVYLESVYLQCKFTHFHEHANILYLHKVAPNPAAFQCQRQADHMPVRLAQPLAKTTVGNSVCCIWKGGRRSGVG